MADAHYFKVLGLKDKYKHAEHAVAETHKGNPDRIGKMVKDGWTEFYFANERLCVCCSGAKTPKPGSR